VQISRTVFREDHEMFRTTVRRFLEKECLPRQAEWIEAGRVDRETWLDAVRAGDEYVINGAKTFISNDLNAAEKAGECSWRRNKLRRRAAQAERGPAGQRTRPRRPLRIFRSSWGSRAN
jgi:hypothetical protein